MSRTLRIPALAAALATFCAVAPAQAGDAVGRAALAACRAAAHKEPGAFDGVVRVSTCQRVTAMRLRTRLAQARAASVQTAKADTSARERGPAAVGERR